MSKSYYKRVPDSLRRRYKHNPIEEKPVKLLMKCRGYMCINVLEFTGVENEEVSLNCDVCDMEHTIMLPGSK